MNIFPQKIYNKFTTHLKKVIESAETISREFNHDSIRVEHIIFGIISEKGSVGSNVLGSEKFDLKNMRRIIDSLPKVKIYKAKLSDDVKDIFKKSVLMAGKYQHSYIGTEHLLYALVSSDDQKIEELFSLVGINTKELKEQIQSIMESSSRFSDIVDFFNLSSKSQKYNSSSNPMSSPQFGTNQNNGLIMEMPSPIATATTKQSVLDYFCIDLVKEFDSGNADCVIGRDQEIEKVINILNRKTKNNPILVGDPGVGKTAIVQGLAERISKGDVPLNLTEKKIYSLDLGLLIAGAVFRGEFEARLKDVIAEAQEDPDIILFIDEIHTIIGAGSTGGSGGLDAANILKPALSRGDLSCIGATTLDEYRKQFKKDAALERRFQMVLVEEPSDEETKKILMGLRRSYEKHHNLKISDEAVMAAVDLSKRFINDRFLPDKAFDILDEAASLVRGRNTGKNYFKEIKKLEEKKKNLRIEKEKAIEEEKYDEALVIKKEEQRIESKINKLIIVQKKEKSVKIKDVVGYDDVASVITQLTGISVKKLAEGKIKKLKNLGNILEKYIVGQKDGIEAVIRAIQRSRLGISDTQKPLGVFLFMGPTGVGKTQLVKTLASTMYEKQDALIKVDMSEFMEKHNVARLIGAPAGYVGYEEGGKLTEQVRLHPYSVILFDEIEKAHPDVFNLMLQIFEDGELTDASGRKVDFKNTMIIMTSNIGAEQLTEEANLGFGDKVEIDENKKNNKIRDRYIETKENIIKEFKNEFNPEFVNRIDKIVVFDPLSLSDIVAIVKIQFNDFRKRIFKSNNIKIDLNKKVFDYLARESFNPNEGARLVKRNLQEMVYDFISEKMINNEIKDGDCIKLDLQDKKIVLKKSTRKKIKRK